MQIWLMVTCGQAWLAILQHSVLGILSDMPGSQVVPIIAWCM